jgi:uncharacterized membrane protein SpoIIM required for sporulation
MKTFLKNSFLERYFKFLLVFVVLFVASFFVVSSASGVPDSYYANKEIQLDRDATLQLFVEIEASMKTSTEVTPAKFSELN